MRIAIPIHSFEPGGVERVALRMAELWRGAGHEPVIVLGRARGACRDTAPELDYRSLVEPFATERWETLWMIWSFFRALLSDRFDAIFCPGNTYTVVCVAMKLLLGDQCPAVLVKISNDLERRDLPRAAGPFYRWWLKVQGAAFDRYVAIAEPMRVEIERQLDLPARCVRVIPDPALSAAELDALSAIQPPPAAAAGCRFLTVGRLVPQKNQRLLIDAFARHSGADDRLVIAGEGPERERLIAQADLAGVRDRVLFLGHVDAVCGIYAAADVFVLPSRYEGVPAAIIEALAAGLPIIATDCCASMAWLTGHGRFGLVIGSDDADEFGLTMNRARHLRTDRQGARRLAADFTLERSARLYLDELHAIEIEHRLSLRQKRTADVRILQRDGV